MTPVTRFQNVSPVHTWQINGGTVSLYQKSNRLEAILRQGDKETVIRHEWIFGIFRECIAKTLHPLEQINMKTYAIVKPLEPDGYKLYIGGCLLGGMLPGPVERANALPLAALNDHERQEFERCEAYRRHNYPDYNYIDMDHFHLNLRIYKNRVAGLGLAPYHSACDVTSSMLNGVPLDFHNLEHQYWLKLSLLADQPRDRWQDRPAADRMNILRIKNAKANIANCGADLEINFWRGAAFVARAGAVAGGAAVGVGVGGPGGAAAGAAGGFAVGEGLAWLCNLAADNVLVPGVTIEDIQAENASFFSFSDLLNNPECHQEVRRLIAQTVNTTRNEIRNIKLSYDADPHQADGFDFDRFGTYINEKITGQPSNFTPAEQQFFEHMYETLLPGARIALDKVRTWINDNEEKRRVQAEDEATWNETVTGLKSTFGFLQALSGVTQCQTLLSVATLGNASVDIVNGIKGISAFLAIGPGANPLALLNPAMAIGMASLSLVSYFFLPPAPNPQQIIIDQLKIISRQVQNMHQDMQLRFNYLDEAVRAMHLDMLKGLDYLANKIQRNHTTMMDYLVIRCDALSAQMVIDHEHQVAIALQNRLAEIVGNVFFIERHHGDDLVINMERVNFERILGNLEHWLADANQHDAFNGIHFCEGYDPVDVMFNDRHDHRPLDMNRIERALRNNDVFSRLGFLGRIAQQIFPAPGPGIDHLLRPGHHRYNYAVVNPYLWERIGSAYCQLLYSVVRRPFMDEGMRNAIRNGIEAIKRPGQKTLDLLQELAYDRPQFDVLLDRISEKRHHLNKSIHNLIIDSIAGALGVPRGKIDQENPFNVGADLNRFTFEQFIACVPMKERPTGPHYDPAAPAGKRKGGGAPYKALPWFNDHDYNWFFNQAWGNPECRQYFQLLTSLVNQGKLTINDFLVNVEQKLNSNRFNKPSYHGMDKFMKKEATILGKMICTMELQLVFEGTTRTFNCEFEFPIEELAVYSCRQPDFIRTEDRGQGHFTLTSTDINEDPKLFEVLNMMLFCNQPQIVEPHLLTEQYNITEKINIFSHTLKLAGNPQNKWIVGLLNNDIERINQAAKGACERMMRPGQPEHTALQLETQQLDCSLLLFKRMAEAIGLNHWPEQLVREPRHYNSSQIIRKWIDAFNEGSRTKRYVYPSNLRVRTLPPDTNIMLDTNEANKDGGYLKITGELRNTLFNLQQLSEVLEIIGRGVQPAPIVIPPVPIVIPPVPIVEGLTHQPVPGDGHCLFHAVSLYLQIPQEGLREIVARFIEEDLEYHRFIDLPEGRNLNDYLNDLREGREWGDDLHLEILMRATNRPIYVIGPDGTIRNDLRRFRGEPIFIYYHVNPQHYDGMILTDPTRWPGDWVLARLIRPIDPPPIIPRVLPLVH